MSVICNCAREARLDGVLYRPLDSVSGIHADVLVMHSSGGGIDLTPLLAVEIEARVRTEGRTGAEMEALHAVAVAALTVYDMVKAADKGMTITDIVLVEKSGGRGGAYRRK